MVEEALRTRYNKVMEYHIFSDESGHGRYRSIGLISGAKNNIANLARELHCILEDNGKKVIEFKKIDGDSTKEKVAKAFIRKGIEKCVEGKIRIDILTWDTRGERHAIHGRDDIKNFQMMYYKILRHVKEKWRHKTLVWGFYPDEHSAIDWHRIISYIEKTNISRKDNLEPDLFNEVKKFSFPTVMDHAELISEEKPVIQLIDIFTGFARYSFEKGKDFLEWRRNEQEKDQLIFFESVPQRKLSRSEPSRFRLLADMDKVCKKNKMKVSIKNHSHLLSYDHNKPLNFWKYESISTKDKAPQRQPKGVDNYEKIC